MSNTQRTDERCHDCLRPLDGQNCSAGGVHDLPTPTDDSVVEEPWTTTFLNAGTEMGLGDLSMMIGTVGKLLTSQSIKHKAEVEKARKEERERIREIISGYIKYSREEIAEMNKNLPSNIQEEAYSKSEGMYQKGYIWEYAKK